MIVRIALLFSVVLLGCPKAPELSAPIATQVDAATVLERAAQQQEMPSIRVKFSAKMRVPRRAIPSLPGVLLVDEPRFRMVLNGPIGGAVFTAIANEQGMVLFDHREARALTVGTGEETALGLIGSEEMDALTKTMLGRIPVGMLSKLSPLSHGEGEWVYRVQREDGARLDLGLDEQGKLRWMETFHVNGTSLLRLVHEEWQEFGDVLLPKRSVLSQSESSLEVTLKYASWVEVPEVGPSAFDTGVAEGIEVLTLQEAIEAAQNQTEESD